MQHNCKKIETFFFFILVSTNLTNDNQVVVALDGSDEDIITYDDKLFGRPQRYHAYVLYAKEDKDFVDELLLRMRREGFKVYYISQSVQPINELG